MVNLVPSVGELTVGQVRGIAALLAEDAITFSQAREVAGAISGTGEDPAAYVDAHGMRQSNDQDALGAIVEEVLGRCTDQVQQYRDGNKKVLGFLVGQCMKAAKGSSRGSERGLPPRDSVLGQALGRSGNGQQDSADPPSARASRGAAYCPGDSLAHRGVREDGALGDSGDNA